MIDNYLHIGALKELFIEHLGWDHARGIETIEAEGELLQLDRVAQKRGFLVLQLMTDTAHAGNRGSDASDDLAVLS